MNFKQKLTAGFATGTAMLTVFSTAAFANTVTVNGNGPFSNNSVKVLENTTTVVNQSNSTTSFNSVNTVSNTGNNTASFNVGGTGSVTSGNVTSTVTVKNVGGSNSAEVEGCGCPEGDTTVRVVGNGPFSNNPVVVSKKTVSMYGQGNSFQAVNSVNTVSNTGGNSSMFNVMSGSTVKSGNVVTNVTVKNKGGHNMLKVTP